MIRELLFVDVYYRQQRGEPLRRDWYYTLLPDHHPVVDSVLDDVTVKPSSPTAPIALDATAPSPANTARSDLSPIGSSLSRYHLIRELGRGAFGIVSLARDTELNRLVAIKRPHEDWLHFAEVWSAFRHEAELAASLEHPSIVTIHDIGQDDDAAPYIVLQYISGVTLRDELRKASLPWPQASVLAAKIADGLQYAHQAGIVHRDLKPGNILLDQEGNPHIADLGLAFHSRDSNSRFDQHAGTYAYMAPEQIRGERDRVDGRSDIWALGVMLYEMLTGQRPFDAADRDQLREQILNTDPPAPPHRDGHSTPTTLARICLKCLRKDPNGRFSTAGQLADELRRCIAQHSARKPKRRGRRQVIATSLAAASILVLGLVALVRPEFGDTSPTAGTIAAVTHDTETTVGRQVTSLSDRLTFHVASVVHPVGTLSAAIDAASDGDTIEIHGDGTSLSRPIQIEGKSLTIRAAPDSQPTVVLDDPSARALLATDSELTLNGLQLRRESDSPARPRGWKPCLVEVTRAGLRMQDCRLQIDGRDRNACVVVDAGPDVVLQRCTFHHEQCGGVFWRSCEQGRMLIEECQFDGNTPIAVSFEHTRVPSVQIARSRLLGREAVLLALLRDAQPYGESAESPRLRLEVCDSQLNAGALLKLAVFGNLTQQFTETESTDLLLRSVRWSDRRCKFSISEGCFAITAGGFADDVSSARTVEQWHRLWETTYETRSDTVIDSVPGPESLPGPVVGENPFWLPSRKEGYSTLREAIVAAAEGETLEIRGDGPYLTDSVNIRGKPLTVRGASASRSVIELAEADAAALFRTDSPLMLERLDLRRTSRLSWAPGRKPGLVYSTGTRLIADDCRFVLHATDPKSACIALHETSDLRLSDCLFEHKGCEAVFWMGPRDGRCVVRGCTFQGCFPFLVGFGALSGPEMSVVRSSLNATDVAFVFHVTRPDAFFESPSPTPLRMEMADSRAQAENLVRLSVPDEYGANDLMRLLRRSLVWSDRRCQFAISSGFLRLGSKARHLPSPGLDRLEQWAQFWNATDTHSTEVESVNGMLRHGNASATAME